jgi:pimeloyl-ACP methyl ester carboxylesterase
MRARFPDVEGFVDRDGVKVAYEVHGDGETTVLLAPTWPVVPARYWKAQVPYLARHFRVITVDPRGNGRSDRPTTADAYTDLACADDLIAVLDAVGVDRAVLVGQCTGAWWSFIAAANHPTRVAGIVAVAPRSPWIGSAPPGRDGDHWESLLDTDEGWDKHNKHYWLREYSTWVEFFIGNMLIEPHSTKQLEDGIGWGLETTAETLVLTYEAAQYMTSRAESEALLARVTCPVLVIRGDGDRIIPPATGDTIAELVNGELLSFDGCGHLPHAREPVRFNLAVHDFISRLDLPRSSPQSTTQRWTRPLDRQRSVLYLSSPIGLGHARRDLAIAEELRRLRPDVQVDWLAQHPVTELLRRRGERVHPASAHLASEAAHVQAESAGHDLHAFQAIRRMDEILVANFMVFADLVKETAYDLWIGDEAWELDYFLHENPELKRSAYAWLTDFVGWLPMPSGGPAEAALTTDYNQEMIERITRFPRLRDRAIFIGNPDDIVPDSFGDGLPSIRDWTRQHFDFTGYVTGFDPAEVADRAALRAELGWRPDDQVCLVAVGGSGVGGALLRRAAEAYPATRQLVPGLRMVAVTGPRIDPASLPTHDGFEAHGYVDSLYRWFAASDMALVQGGLTTGMELTATGRPFLYVPLRDHFEQNYHVRHRLERHGAGRCLMWEDTEPDALAHAIAQEIGREVTYRPVETDGATRAAARIAELL